MSSIFFKYPLLYDWGIRFLYFDGLMILKNIIGRNKSVFEPACGFGRMKRYLFPDCTYSGIDLNEKFVRYGQKKNRDITLGDILDPQYYRTADTVLLCDILHHLKPADIRKLLCLAVQYARESVVIIEPTFVRIASGNNFVSRAIGRIMSIVDADGINKIEHWMSRKEYDELFESLKEDNHIDQMSIRHHRNHDFVEMRIHRDAQVKPLDEKLKN